MCGVLQLVCADLLTQPRRLRVGYFTSNLFFPPASCCVRAVHEAVEALRAFSRSGKGVEVEVVPWTPPALTEGALLANKVFTADGCNWLRSELQGEWAHESVLGGLVLGSLPAALCRGIGRFLKCSSATYRLGMLLESSFGRSCRSVSDSWRLNAEVNEFRCKILESFQGSGLDAVICPTMGLPAIEHGNSTHLLPVVTYTSLFNVLEWPAGNVPVTRVAPNECEYIPQEFYCFPDCDELLRRDSKLSNMQFKGDVIAQLAHKQMQGAVGMPVGISVAALPYNDELVLDIMRILEVKFPFKPAC
jgi:fatty acid amide hydrolase